MSKSLQDFSFWGIQHNTGILYNPQGQAIIDRNHQNIKAQLQKQKEGINPHQQSGMALFTINILNFQKNQLESQFQKYWGQQELRPEVQVKWKDSLMGQWRGPYPFLTLGRGFGCVYPIGDSNPVWVPARDLKFYCQGEDDPDQSKPPMKTNKERKKEWWLCNRLRRLLTNT